MNKAKGRKILTDRRGFLGMALAAFGAPFGLAEAQNSPAAPPATPKPSPQRARLPKRLAADFHKHIDSRLPLLRAPFEAAAKVSGLNWKMLAALGYQESRWRAAAVSPRGAQGIMMLMPVTAKKMGVKNVFDADENIMGGAKYLAYMRSRIPKRIRDPDRMWLAIAAYNIGIGHLEDARVITQMRKRNPDSWPDVRANLPRKSDPVWHSRVKHGYANGRETVQFVERVTQFAAILESAVPDRVTAKG
jgi:membrane-bound lytic murein transglycosylase F